MAAALPLVANGVTTAAITLAPYITKAATKAAIVAKPAITEGLKTAAKNTKAGVKYLADGTKGVAGDIADAARTSLVFEGATSIATKTGDAIGSMYSKVTGKGEYDSIRYSITDLITIAIVIVLLCMIFYLAAKGVQQIVGKHF
jgi:hypothetical protein